MFERLYTVMVLAATFRSLGRLRVAQAMSKITQTQNMPRRHLLALAEILDEHCMVPSQNAAGVLHPVIQFTDRSIDSGTSEHIRRERRKYCLRDGVLREIF